MNVVTQVFEVFTNVIEWLVTAIQAVIPVFWTAESGLTFMGVLAVISLALGIAFLILRLVQNFLHFRA